MVEVCIHVANVFYLASFLGRDMLWLRTLTCCGLVLGIVFFTCQPRPLYGPVVWHIAFLFINCVMIRRLLLERRQLSLTPEQEKAAEAAFSHLSREELLTVLTRVMHATPRRLRDLRRAASSELTEEERALQAIALSRLSQKELLNLLTRRAWGVLRRVNPATWRGRERMEPTAAAHTEHSVGGVR